MTDSAELVQRGNTVVNSSWTSGRVFIAELGPDAPLEEIAPHGLVSVIEAARTAGRHQLSN